MHAWCEMATPQDGGEEIRQSAMAEAQRIAQEELDALGWAAQDLQGRRKSDPQKVRIAARLRRQATMTWEWIADRLCMGAATHVASLLQRHNQKGPSSEEPLFWPPFGGAGVWTFLRLKRKPTWRVDRLSLIHI